MDSTALVDRLRAELGSSAVVTDVDVMASYSRDMMPLAPCGSPLAVVMPADTEGVQ
ncbi:MAG: FAD-binding oxidoreductase, partial [Actinophytocola sp.]|nr:FAD-binding oxidoreductase [Actinophytocola sp.]